MRTVAAVFLVLLLSACNRPRYDTPVNAYLTFSRAVQKDDLRGAFKALSTSTRDVLSEKAKELAKVSGGSMREEPAVHLFSPGVRPPEVTKVDVVKEEGGTALLKVESAGKTQEVHMVREAEEWRVDLSQTLKSPG
ncbi:MAG: hypothetical protein ACT4TC_09380 [Myxococcaceae bacterium]